MPDDGNSASVVLVEAGLDYLTVTSPWEHAALELLHLGQRLAKETQHSGNQLRPWQWYGYAGQMAQDIAYGQRKDGALLRLAGGLSHVAFRDVAAYAGKCSRIDLQATARVYPNHRDLVRESYSEADLASTARGTPLDVSMILNNRGGSTLYLGSRVSEIFGRLYNKEKQSHDPQYQGCWRWEVEYKGETALAVFRQLVQSAPHPITSAATVHQYFVTRGVTVPWRPPADRSLKTPTVPRSDDERRIAWLGTQVRQVVDELSTRIDRGRIAQVLGLAQEASQAPNAAVGGTGAPKKVRKEVNRQTGDKR